MESYTKTKNFYIQGRNNSTIVHNRKLSFITKAFPPVLFYKDKDQWIVKTTPKYITILIKFLKLHTPMSYNQLIDLTAVDYPQRKLRFEILYQLLSISNNKRLTLSISSKENGIIDSLTSLYSSAGWYERETWDIFGIFFKGHPDLRRILTDYGFKGHPLRKDFPLTGFLEVRYNDFYKRICYEKTTLAQDYRNFNGTNAWSILI